MLELADRFHHARDHRLDLVGRANPGAARCDLAVERERTQPAHRGVVVAVILRGGAARPIADRLGERAKIFLERRPRHRAGAARILVAEHVERDHHLAVAAVSDIAPGVAIARSAAGSGRSGSPATRRARDWSAACGGATASSLWIEPVKGAAPPYIALQ